MGRHHLLNLGQVGLRDDTPTTAEQRRRVWGIRRRRRLGHHPQRSKRAAKIPGGSASRSAAWCFHDFALALAHRPSCLDMVTLLRKEMVEHPELVNEFDVTLTDRALTSSAAA
jgi:hypothetical protein